MKTFLDMIPDRTSMCSHVFACSSNMIKFEIGCARLSSWCDRHVKNGHVTIFAMWAWCVQGAWTPRVRAARLFLRKFSWAFMICLRLHSPSHSCKCSFLKWLHNLPFVAMSLYWTNCAIQSKSRWNWHECTHSGCTDSCWLGHHVKTRLLSQSAGNHSGWCCHHNCSQPSSWRPSDGRRPSCHQAVLLWEPSHCKHWRIRLKGRDQMWLSPRKSLSQKRNHAWMTLGLGFLASQSKALLNQQLHYWSIRCINTRPRRLSISLRRSASVGIMRSSLRSLPDHYKLKVEPLLWKMEQQYQVKQCLLLCSSASFDKESHPSPMSLHSWWALMCQGSTVTCWSSIWVVDLHLDTLQQH